MKYTYNPNTVNTMYSTFYLLTNDCSTLLQSLQPSFAQLGYNQYITGWMYERVDYNTVQYGTHSIQSTETIKY